MTGQEAAEQEERDVARQRRRAAIQAEEAYSEHSFWATQMITKTQHHHSQGETQLVSKTQLSTLNYLSKTPSIDLSSEDSFRSNSPESITGNQEPRWSGRVKWPTQNAASQVSQDRAAAVRSLKGKKVRKTKLMNTSQLLDEFA
jgi:hypothetical protein